MESNKPFKWKLNNNILRLACISIFFIFFSVTFSIAYAANLQLSAAETAWIEANPTITLGSDSQWEPYIIKQDDGSIIGFDTDILALINKNTGANFQLTTGTWKEMGAKLKSGAIDGVSTSSARFAKANSYNYTKPYFSFQKTLIVASNNPKQIKSIEDLGGKRIGYQSGNQFNKSVLEKYKQAILVPMNSLSEVVDALIVGDIDAAIGSNSIYYVQKDKAAYMKTVALFPDSTLNLVFSLRADYPEAISILNKGLDSIPVNTKMRIANSWFFEQHKETAEASTSPIDFTDAEKAFLDKKPYISVGSLNNFAPFNFIKNDKPSGYSVEYMRLIGQQLGKEVKFVEKSWSEQLRMLKTGQLDLIPHIAVTEERRENIEYTNFNHITYTTGFAIRKGESVNSMADLNGKTIAVAKKTFLHAYLSKNFPQIKLLPVVSTNAAIEAVSNDQAYGVIGSLPSLTYYMQNDWRSNLKIINIKDLGLPGKTELPMGVAKGNLVLKSLLEKAYSTVPADEIQKLKQKWIFDTPDFSLNKAEQDFIKKHPVIRFRIRPDRPPFELVQNGKAAGIAVDYLTEVAQFAGFTPKFVVSDMPIMEAYNMVELDRSDFDTLAFSVKDEERSERFAFGDNYLSYPMMIITHKDSPYIGKTSDLIGKSVAIEKGFLTNKWLRADYPGIRISTAVSTVEALQMVNDKEADAYIGNVAVANFMISHGNLNNLKIIAPSDYGTIDYSFIAPKEWPELASILSKGYLSLPSGFHHETQQKWFSFRVVKTLDELLLWQILSIASLFFTVVLWWNRTLRKQKLKTERALTKLHNTQHILKKQNEILKKLSITDKLTSLYNRMKLDSVLQNEFERSKRYGNIFGVILIDIDHFKQINDIYGHQTGDRVLVEIAEILINNIRKVDIVGRWGGEEFLVVCPETGEDGACKVAENLRSSICSYDFSDVGHLTASFGISIFDGADFCESIISKADIALYNSKKSGRNRVSIN